MTDQHKKPMAGDWAHEIDAALARYAAAEPRAGLESRILANLHATGAQATGRNWWSWTTAGVLAFAILMVAGMVGRFEKARRDTLARRPTVQAQLPQAQRPGQNGSTHLPQGVAIHKPPVKSQGLRVHDKLASSHPKLEQFPSPQPLSAQEKLLANYVAEYPTHAAQIAQARADALLRDSQEELGANGTGTR